MRWSMDLRSRGMPLTLLSQYLPRQYAAIRDGRIANDPHEILLDAVRAVLDGYAACLREPGSMAETQAAFGMSEPALLGGRGAVDCGGDPPAAGVWREIGRSLPPAAPRSPPFSPRCCSCRSCASCSPARAPPPMSGSAWHRP